MPLRGAPSLVCRRWCRRWSYGNFLYSFKAAPRGCATRRMHSTSDRQHTLADAVAARVRDPGICNQLIAGVAKVVQVTV